MKKILTILTFFCFNANAQTVTLTGSGSDTDGTISSYLWAKVAGPASGIITSPSSAITTVTGLVQGVYKFELTVTDNLGATGKDTVQITVLAGNVRPKSNAGGDQSIQLPTTGALLKGSGTDADGYITAYQWSRTSGPNNPIIQNDKLSKTLVTGLKAGSYVFNLKVTDNKGAIGTDNMSVIVRKRYGNF